MFKIKLLLIIFFCGIVFTSCSKTSNPATTAIPSDTTYLLNHSRFEQGGNYSLNGWKFNPAQPDDALDHQGQLNGAPSPLGWSSLHPSGVRVT